MVNYRKYNPVRPVTRKGSWLIKILRLAFWFRKLIGLPQWKYLVPEHHEDPLKMRFAEKLYMGYKYYYKALVHAEKDSGLEAYFRNQTLEPVIPADFVPETTISLSAGGDLIPYDCIIPENCEHLWDEAGDYFFNNDIVFANLETVADPAQPYSAAPEVMLADMFFNVHEESFRIFSGNGKYKGYDVLATANNHTMDVGEAGVIATQRFLQQKGIAWCGTALSADTRDNFPIIERQGIKVAFLAYTFSLNKETLPEGKEWLANHIFLNEANPDISLIIHQANLARQRGADIVVAALHMGCAYQAYPNMHTVNNIHQICEQAGIDIVLGGHPHNPQPLEIYQSEKKQHFIIYSLGDFIAYDIYKWCHLPLIVKFKISKGEINGQQQTLVSGWELKPFYFYQNSQQKLQLIDFQKIIKDTSYKFSEKEVQKEVEELKDFFSNFIVTSKQSTILK